MKHDKASKLARAFLEEWGFLDEKGHTFVPNKKSHESAAFQLCSPLGFAYLFVGVGEGGAEAARILLSESHSASCAVFLDSAGKNPRVVRKSFRTGDIERSTLLDRVKQRSKFAWSYAPLDTANTRPLKVLSQDLQNVLFEVHSALRDIDGLHAPDALDEICKLIYAKLHDEENVNVDGCYIFQRNPYNSVDECAAAIRTLYQNAVAQDHRIFGNRIPAYKRSRGVFGDPLFMSSQAIAKIATILAPFDITNSPEDIKGRAFQNVLQPATRAGMGQYFTPKKIIDLCVQMLGPTVRDAIIDPFCGSGHFLTSSLDLVRREGGHSEKHFHEFAFTRLHGVEKSERMVRVAMTDMRLHGDGHSNIRCTDALLPFDTYSDLHRETFDIVATNPPFGVDLPQEALSDLGRFDVVASQRQGATISLEVLAVNRCLDLLRPGGRMAIVLPDGILSNRNTTYVREWIEKQAKIRAIVSLPVETFTPFGANIKTSVIFLRKLNPGEEPADYKVFLAEVRSVGHDASGRPIECDDFDELADQFSHFIKLEEW